MNQRPQADTFVVEGRGEFPHDMLRRDYASALTPEDQARIDESYDDEGDTCGLRRVSLTTRERDVTEARWESFGWQVVVPLPDWSPHRGYSGLPPLERTRADPRHDVTIRVTCPDGLVARQVGEAMAAAAKARDGVIVSSNVVERHVGD